MSALIRLHRLRRRRLRRHGGAVWGGLEACSAPARSQSPTQRPMNQCAGPNTPLRYYPPNRSAREESNKLCRVQWTLSGHPTYHRPGFQILFLPMHVNIFYLLVIILETLIGPFLQETGVPSCRDTTWLDGCRPRRLGNVGLDVSLISSSSWRWIGLVISRLVRRAFASNSPSHRSDLPS